MTYHPASTERKAAPMVLRISKILLVTFVALFALLVGIDNLLDYQTNFEAVRHILSMDSIVGDNPLSWRAITSESMHRLAYGLIIATELVSGIVCSIGAFRLGRAMRLDGPSFNAQKDVAVIGLVALFALFFFGFMIIGGEWFQMWRAPQWNGQEAAFRFIGCIGLILLFVCQPDADHD
jgi:predicted small integral membrane protein